MKLEIYREKAVYENNGKYTEYYKYYVLVNGIKIYFKVNDATGKQMLNNELDKELRN